jgi:hypothetical protein
VTSAGPTAPARFPIRFTGANRAMALLGILPAHSAVELDERDLRVHMSWAFYLRAPRTSVRAAALDNRPVMGWGVHGWRGSWLVNGSSSGIVRVALDPPAHAWLMEVFPLRVDTLRVSVEHPDSLIAALVGPPATTPAAPAS